MTDTREPTMKRSLLAAALTALVATAATAETPAVPETAHLDYRHHLMEVIGTNMSAIGDILKNKMPLTDNLAVHAKGLHGASSLVVSAFEAKALSESSESLPVIWEQWDDFVAAAQATEEAAANLAAVAESGDVAAIGAAVRGVGRTCGACHRTFRKQDD